MYYKYNISFKLFFIVMITMATTFIQTVAAQTATTNTTEKHRFWLNIYGPSNTAYQAMVGYIENATNGYDRGYDGEIYSTSSITLYSICEEINLAIQGRALPFENTDAVVMGFKTATEGLLTIAIDHYDGLFENQDIFLVDTYENKAQNLKVGNYTFHSLAGTCNDRFMIMYVAPQNLRTPTYDYNKNTIKITQSTSQLTVETETALQAIAIYDLTGKLLAQHIPNTTTYSIEKSWQQPQAIIIQTIDKNSTRKNSKILSK